MSGAPKNTLVRLGGPNLAIDGADALQYPVQLKLSDDIRRLVISTLEDNAALLAPWTQEDIKIHISIKGLTSKSPFEGIEGIPLGLSPTYSSPRHRGRRALAPPRWLMIYLKSKLTFTSSGFARRWIPTPR